MLYNNRQSVCIQTQHQDTSLIATIVCLVIYFHARINLVPRAMPVRGLGWHWLWGNGMICVRFHTRSLNAHARTDYYLLHTIRIRNL